MNFLLRNRNSQGIRSDFIGANFSWYDTVKCQSVASLVSRER